MLVKDVMARNVMTTGPETGIKEAARTMADNRIGSLVVVKNGRMVGIITEHDILCALANSSGSEINSIRVGDAMTQYVIPISPASSIETAVRLMNDNRVKKLPVIENETVVGIITASDIITAQPGMISSMKRLISNRPKNK